MLEPETLVLLGFCAALPYILEALRHWIAAKIRHR